MLARSGVGNISIFDNDIVELSNLHRQNFTEKDAFELTPKVEAIARKIWAVNQNVEVRHFYDTVTPDKLEPFSSVDIVVDELENATDRYMLNDLCIEKGIPCVFAGVSGVVGTVYVLLPKTKKGDSPWEKMGITTPSFRDIFPQNTKELESNNDDKGVLGPLLSIIANMQVIEALKILCGLYKEVNTNFRSLNGWTGELRNLKVR
jgi:adenylyltransferase/sulfurtransferase